MSSPELKDMRTISRVGYDQLGMLAAHCLSIPRNTMLDAWLR